MMIASRSGSCPPYDPGRRADGAHILNKRDRKVSTTDRLGQPEAKLEAAQSADNGPCSTRDPPGAPGAASHTDRHAANRTANHAGTKSDRRLAARRCRQF